METVRDCIEQHAAATPDRLFLIAPDNGDSLTFAELKLAVDELGHHLDQLGLERGAKVAFLLNNGYWPLRLFLGVMASNRVIVPLNAVAGTVQLVHVLDHSDAEVVFVAPEYRDKLAEIMAQCIEAQTELEVERKFGLGGTLICFEALKSGEIDIYPEYTGTITSAILKWETSATRF